MSNTKPLNNDTINNFLTLNDFNNHMFGLGVNLNRFMTMCPDGIERFSKEYYSEKHKMLIIHDFEKYAENNQSYPKIMFSSQTKQLQNEISIYDCRGGNAFIGLSINKYFKYRVNLNQINSVELFDLLKVILKDPDLIYFPDEKPHWEYILAGMFTPIKIYPPDLKDFDIMEYLLNNLPRAVSTIQPLQTKDNYSNFTALKSDGNIIKVIFKK